MTVSALYLHVPFCPSICPYCDFHKMLRNESLVARYLDRLGGEAAELSARFPGPLETLYLGGGTPSHLTDDELGQVFTALRSGWGRAAGSDETTLEADPLTFDEARLDRFHGLGVTRLSIGLQSTDDATLRFLGRVHDGEEGRRAVSQALQAGFRVNVDVIMAVPGQDLGADLRRVMDLGARHVSVYSLTIEPNTPFARRGVTVDPEADADAFELAGSVLAEYGLERYEVSNFAVPGEESRHNLGYWRGRYYLGLGPSASAYLPGGAFGVRTKNPPIKTWLLGARPELDTLGPDDYLLERLMTGLRTREGLPLLELEDRLGARLEAVAPAWWRDVTRHGLLSVAEGRLRATPTGLERLDALLRAFVRDRASLDALTG
ncbi:MAG: radical SAM family heme chaperone HemW [Trueperaceae bacterium]|nr:radical SAM family heme chaperone HemW [Trueperaceae bacterium]HRQ10114.1 radical SAM family heme chaperone HemW [Trueperaceae bacterium]